MIRIISGRFRGKKIAGPKKWDGRPTTDRAKESLFNILNNHFYFDEIRALDLFCGLGSISLELASRGCTDITAVDGNRLAVSYLDKLSDEMELEGFFPVQSDALGFLAKAYQPYDLIFADPPYDFEEYEKLANAVFATPLLKENGMLVIEHQSKVDLSELAHFQEVRKYGNSSFSFFYLA